MNNLINANNNNNNCDGFLTVMSERWKNLLSKQPIAEVYNVEQRPFARGKFATVRRCRHKKTNMDYAAKFIRKRRRAMDICHEILHEIAVLELSQPCSCIVHMHEVFETSSEFVIVMELATGGELQRLIDEDEILKEKEVIRFMNQILEGIAFLHDRKIAHLDLKPQNILLTNKFPNCNVKLCDFGISRVITDGVELREILGTPDYVAPEILNYEPITLATDMWSVGVLAYVLLSGHSPFGGDSKQETFCNISQGNFDFPDDLFQDVSALALDFIRKLLVKDPCHRLTVRECLNHPWLQLKDTTNEVNNQLKSVTTTTYKSSPILTYCPGLKDDNDLHQVDNEMEMPKRLKFSENLIVGGEGVVC